MVRVKGSKGEYVEAEQLKFDAIREDWNIYRLEDGKILKVKLVVTEVYKLDEIDETTGRNNYLIRSTNVISIEEPD